MPPIFYVELTEKQRNIVEGSPEPKFRTIVTRHYTELDPDPLTVVNRLAEPMGGDNLPPVFYEIEKKSGLTTGLYKTAPFLTGIKPLSVELQPGNWAKRVDWTVKWELAEEVQPPLELMGLKLYEWRKTEEYSEEAAEVIVGHRLFPNGNEDRAGYLQKLRTNKPTYSIVGKVAGQLDFSALRLRIKADTSIVGFSYAYNLVTDITDVQIRLEHPESEDRVNG